MSNKIYMLKYGFKDQRDGKLIFYQGGQEGDIGLTFGVSENPNFSPQWFYYFDYSESFIALDAGLLKKLLERYVK